MNIEPLKSFLEEEIPPSELSVLLNELLDDYVDLIIKQQLMDDEKRPYINTDQFIHILRRLRDVIVAVDRYY